MTNQGGIAAGHKTLENCIEEQQFTLKLFPKIQSILFCPDFEGKKCYRCYIKKVFDVSNKYPLIVVGYYRKPALGMINHILISNEADPHECLMVGDQQEDKDCAEAAGIQFLWAETWRSLP